MRADKLQLFGYNLSVLRALFGGLVLFLAMACRQAPPSPAPQPPAPALKPQAPDRVTLIFSASVAGQLVPCGCSPDQRGGLPRAVAYVKRLREGEPNLLFIDAGDLLFETPSRPSPQMLTQKTLKARTLAQGDELLEAAARAVGERDLALGAQFALDTAGKVPLLDAGVAPLPGARATLLASAGAIPVGIFSAGFEDDPAATIAARARELRRQGAQLVVLLLHPRGANAWTAAQALLPPARAAGVDLVVLGRRDDPATDPSLKDSGPPPLLAMEGHGQSLARLDVHFGSGLLALLPTASDRDEEVKALQARIDRFRSQLELYPQRRAQLEAKIRELQERAKALASAPVPRPPEGSTWAEASFVPLTDQVGTDAAAQRLVDAYDSKVAELNLAEAKSQPEECPPPARGEPFYVGANRCAQCHEEAGRRSSGNRPATPAPTRRWSRCASSTASTASAAT